MEAFGKNHQLNDITQKVIQYMQKQSGFGKGPSPQYSEQEKLVRLARTKVCDSCS